MKIAVYIFYCPRGPRPHSAGQDAASSYNFYIKPSFSITVIKVGDLSYFMFGSCTFKYVWQSVPSHQNQSKFGIISRIGLYEPKFCDSLTCYYSVILCLWISVDSETLVGRNKVPSTMLSFFWIKYELISYFTWFWLLT